MYGNDEFGTSYPNIDAMWEAELNAKGNIKVNNRIGSKKRWYQLGGKYWDQKSADYNGVMGGFANLNDVDINFSRKFMEDISKKLPRLKFNQVLDCGAGIGRITKQLLSNLFKTVDVVDQCQKYINRAKEILKDKNVRKYYCKGLQDFNFEHKYDCIWLQWVLTYLSDEDSVAFLMKAKANLKEGGVIIVKQNASEKGFFVDKLDCSVIRSNMLWKKLFAQAGLKLIKQEQQLDWPKDMFDIRMYALQ